MISAIGTPTSSLGRGCRAAPMDQLLVMANVVGGESRVKQRLDFRDKTGGGGEALPGVVALLAIPNLKHRIAIGTVELLEDAVAQNARTIGIACRGAVVEQFILPPRNVTFLQ